MRWRGAQPEHVHGGSGLLVHAWDGEERIGQSLADFFQAFTDHDSISAACLGSIEGLVGGRDPVLRLGDPGAGNSRQALACRDS